MKRFSKKLSTVLLALLLALAMTACQSSGSVDAVVEITVPEESATVEATAPAVEEAAPIQEAVPEEAAPVEEPVQEETEAQAAEPVVAQEASSTVMESGTLSMYGYSLSYEAVPGSATVYYPGFITSDEIDAFFAFSFTRHASILQGVYYEVTAPGVLTVTFPEDVSHADAEAVVMLMAQDLVDFISSYLGVETSTDDVVIEQNEPVVVAETGTLSLYGYSVSYEAVPGKATVKYPSIITKGDIDAFFAYAAGKHPALLSGVYYSIPEEGTLSVTFPEDVTVADATAVVALLVQDLVDFIPSYLAPAEEAAPVVDEVIVEPVTGTLSYAGYSISYEAVPGKATVKYASPITQADVQQFFAFSFSKHPSLFSTVFAAFPEEGVVELTFPTSVTVADVESLFGMMEADIDEFISLFYAPAEEAAPAVEAVAEEAAPAQELPYGVTPIIKAEGGSDDFNLYIVHTNDVHGRIVEGEDGSLGYAKLSTLLQMGRSVTDNILVFDAGDVLHGTNLANVFQGESVGTILTMLGYDAVAPGNHDFNYGYERLVELAGESEAAGGPKVLSANILYDEDGTFVFQPYQVYSFNGFDVVVIGLTTPDTKTKAHPRYTEGLTFWDDSYAQYAQAAVDLANELGDYVIVLGHVGLDADGSSGITSDWICSNINGIDLFIDGHSHTILENGMEVNGTLIVSTGQYLNNIGLVEVQVRDGEAVDENAILIPASEVIDPSTSGLAKMAGITQVADDPAVTAYVEDLNAQLEERFSEVVATVPMDLDGERANVRTRVTNLSRLVCEAMTAETGADFTITNGGGIRASIAAGDVTLGDINNVLPFTNVVNVCEITGDQVYEALEFGYSLLPEQNGAFSQSDLRVVYSGEAEPGSRIVSVLLPDGTPLDRNATYTVATNDFMAAGGDGYTMFGRVVQEGRQLNEVFADYLGTLYPPQV